MAQGWTRIADSSDIQAILNAINALKTGIDAFRGAYTDARAINLDKLDEYVSSRAPANTALSNTVYTNQRAANLDKLDEYVSSRARQDMLGLSTDIGAWTGAQYNENLHQKASDIMSWLYSTLTNTNTMMAKGVPGDFVGKDIVVTYANFANGVPWTYANNKGGLAIIRLISYSNENITITIDDVQVANGKFGELWAFGNGIIVVPFTRYISLVGPGMYSLAANMYINK